MQGWGARDNLATDSTKQMLCGKQGSGVSLNGLCEEAL